MTGLKDDDYESHISSVNVAEEAGDRNQQFSYSEDKLREGSTSSQRTSSPSTLKYTGDNRVSLDTEAVDSLPTSNYNKATKSESARKSVSFQQLTKMIDTFSSSGEVLEAVSDHEEMKSIDGNGNLGAIPINSTRPNSSRTRFYPSDLAFHKNLSASSASISSPPKTLYETASSNFNSRSSIDKSDVSIPKEYKRGPKVGNLRPSASNPISALVLEEDRQYNNTPEPSLSQGSSSNTMSNSYRIITPNNPTKPVNMGPGKHGRSQSTLSDRSLLTDISASHYPPQTPKLKSHLRSKSAYSDKSFNGELLQKPYLNYDDESAASSPMGIRRSIISNITNYEVISDAEDGIRPQRLVMLDYGEQNSDHSNEQEHSPINYNKPGSLESGESASSYKYDHNGQIKVKKIHVKNKQVEHQYSKHDAPRIASGASGLSGISTGSSAFTRASSNYDNPPVGATGYSITTPKVPTHSYNQGRGSFGGSIKGKLDKSMSIHSITASIHSTGSTEGDNVSAIDSPADIKTFNKMQLDPMLTAENPLESTATIETVKGYSPTRGNTINATNVYTAPKTPVVVTSSKLPDPKVTTPLNSREIIVVLDDHPKEESNINVISDERTQRQARGVTIGDASYNNNYKEMSYITSDETNSNQIGKNLNIRDVSPTRSLNLSSSSKDKDPIPPSTKLPLTSSTLKNNSTHYQSFDSINKDQSYSMNRYLKTVPTNKAFKAELDLKNNSDLFKKDFRETSPQRSKTHVNSVISDTSINVNDGYRIPSPSKNSLTSYVSYTHDSQQKLRQMRTRPPHNRQRSLAETAITDTSSLASYHTADRYVSESERQMDIDRLERDRSELLRESEIVRSQLESEDDTLPPPTPLFRPTLSTQMLQDRISEEQLREIDFESERQQQQHSDGVKSDLFLNTTINREISDQELVTPVGQVTDSLAPKNSKNSKTPQSYAGTSVYTKTPERQSTGGNTHYTKSGSRSSKDSKNSRNSKISYDSSKGRIASAPPLSSDMSTNRATQDKDVQTESIPEEINVVPIKSHSKPTTRKPSEGVQTIDKENSKPQRHSAPVPQTKRVSLAKSHRHSQRPKSSTTAGHGHHHSTSKKLRPFSYPSVMKLLEITDGTMVGQEFDEINIPNGEKRLIEKVIDSLSRLTVDMNLDDAKKEEGKRRLTNALRALEGWI